MELTFPFLLPFQERLSYIGPEEFIQAFIQKDPLDNKVMSSNPPNKRMYSGGADYLVDLCRWDLCCGGWIGAMQPGFSPRLMFAQHRLATTQVRLRAGDF